MKMKRTIAALLLTLLTSGAAAVRPALAHDHPETATPAPAPGPAVPGTGLDGRILYNDEELAGVRVYVYRSFEDVLSHKPFTVSAPSDEDGVYALDLPPGIWFVVAKKLAAGAADAPLALGDLFSYQGSNPLQVLAGAYTHVGFIMARKNGEIAYADSSDKGSGSIEGVVTYGGEPLAGATVFLFVDSAENFRGEMYASTPPTGTSGSFRLDTLPQSDYYVIVRKRSGEIPTGPLNDNDFFAYFIENPVKVRNGTVAHIEVEAMSKAGLIIRKGTAFRETGTQIRGRIVDKEGKPARGVYAFAYREKVMAHRRPAAISRLVEPDGSYVINLPEGGVYYLGARSKYGEGPGMGEWYGRYDVTADHSLAIETGQKLEGIDMQVELILP
jgi:hypothetical protein